AAAYIGVGKEVKVAQWHQTEMVHWAAETYPLLGHWRPLWSNTTGQLDEWEERESNSLSPHSAEKARVSLPRFAHLCVCVACVRVCVCLCVCSVCSVCVCVCV